LCICSVPFEERKASVLLRKPCLDISMWAGYDPNDSQKNLDYYKTWYKQFVASPGHGNATMDEPTTNTRHVFYLQLSQSVLFCDVSSCPFHTDILLLLKQEWSRSARNGFVGPITCIQDLLDFYA